MTIRESFAAGQSGHRIPVVVDLASMKTVYSDSEITPQFIERLQSEANALSTDVAISVEVAESMQHVRESKDKTTPQWVLRATHESDTTQSAPPSWVADEMCWIVNMPYDLSTFAVRHVYEFHVHQTYQTDTNITHFLHGSPAAAGVTRTPLTQSKRHRAMATSGRQLHNGTQLPATVLEFLASDKQTRPPDRIYSWHPESWLWTQQAATQLLGVANLDPKHGIFDFVSCRWPEVRPPRSLGDAVAFDESADFYTVVDCLEEACFHDPENPFALLNLALTMRQWDTVWLPPRPHVNELREYTWSGVLGLLQAAIGAHADNGKHVLQWMRQPGFALLLNMQCWNVRLPDVLRRLITIDRAQVLGGSVPRSSSHAQAVAVIIRCEEERRAEKGQPLLQETRSFAIGLFPGVTPLYALQQLRALHMPFRAVRDPAASVRRIDVRTSVALLFVDVLLRLRGHTDANGASVKDTTSQDGSRSFRRLLNDDVEKVILAAKTAEVKGDAKTASLLRALRAARDMAAGFSSSATDDCRLDDHQLRRLEAVALRHYIFPGAAEVAPIFDVDSWVTAPLMAADERNLLAEWLSPAAVEELCQPSLRPVQFTLPVPSEGDFSRRDEPDAVTLRLLPVDISRAGVPALHEALRRVSGLPYCKFLLPLSCTVGLRGANGRKLYVLIWRCLPRSGSRQKAADVTLHRASMSSRSPFTDRTPLLDLRRTKRFAVQLAAAGMHLRIAGVRGCMFHPTNVVVGNPDLGSTDHKCVEIRHDPLFLTAAFECGSGVAWDRDRALVAPLKLATTEEVPGDLVFEHDPTFYIGAVDVYGTGLQRGQNSTRYAGVLQRLGSAAWVAPEWRVPLKDGKQPPQPDTGAADSPSASVLAVSCLAHDAPCTNDAYSLGLTLLDFMAMCVERATAASDADPRPFGECVAPVEAIDDANPTPLFVGSRTPTSSGCRTPQASFSASTTPTSSQPAAATEPKSPGVLAAMDFLLARGDSDFAGAADTDQLVPLRGVLVALLSEDPGERPGLGRVVSELSRGSDAQTIRLPDLSALSSASSAGAADRHDIAAPNSLLDRLQEAGSEQLDIRANAEFEILHQEAVEFERHRLLEQQEHHHHHHGGSSSFLFHPMSALPWFRRDNLAVVPSTLSQRVASRSHWDRFKHIVWRAVAELHTTRYAWLRRRGDGKPGGMRAPSPRDLVIARLRVFNSWASCDALPPPSVGHSLCWMHTAAQACQLLTALSPLPESTDGGLAAMRFLDFGARWAVSDAVRLDTSRVDAGYFEEFRTLSLRTTPQSIRPCGFQTVRHAWALRRARGEGMAAEQSAVVPEYLGGFSAIAGDCWGCTPYLDVPLEATCIIAETGAVESRAMWRFAMDPSSAGCRYVAEDAASEEDEALADSATSTAFDVAALDAAPARVFLVGMLADRSGKDRCSGHSYVGVSHPWLPRGRLLVFEAHLQPPYPVEFIDEEEFVRRRGEAARLCMDREPLLALQRTAAPRSQ